MDLRLKVIHTALKKAGLDGIIVSSADNITYLTRYRSRDSYLLVSNGAPSGLKTGVPFKEAESRPPFIRGLKAAALKRRDKKSIYFTDSRYIEEAGGNLKGIALKETHGSFFKLLAQACVSLGLKRVGFEGSYLDFKQYQRIEEELKGKARLFPVYGLIEEKRQIKSAEELEKIRKATQITVEALRFIRDFIRPGIKEAEIAGELERFIRYNGGYASAFDIIVACGPNSSFPHHLTSQKKVSRGEPVLIDIGVDYEGYKSDLTRVFFSDKINSTFRKVYAIVRQAQDRAIKAIKPGVFINKVDAAARQYIARKGYGGFFSHSLGHGIGLAVHEEPRISQKEKDILKTGMVLTVEPAVYLPGRFGVRIEDMVLVTRKGYEVISGALNQ